jgi:hypothetical protein
MNGAAATAKADAKGMLPATGISIPYSLKPGAYTITATGATSKRVSSAAITVAKLTPSIAISTPSASPGAMETVTGKGFGTKEQVTLSLNGEPLATSPAIITTTNGAFTATFKVPTSLLRGSNTVGALGNESRVSAVAALTGMLTRVPEFYFAGGVVGASGHSYVAMLNPNKQPASVRLTFYFDNGASYTRLVDVPASSQQRVDVATLDLPQSTSGGTFGLELKADRQLAAQLVVNRGGMDGDNVLGDTGLDTHWYLAAGSTKDSFQERISILNPDPTIPAHVALQLITASGSKTVSLTVPAHTNYVANVNSLAPNQDVSAIVSADRLVAVERSLTFGPGGRGLTMAAGTNRAATNWLFSDATTENNVRTVFAILNPGAFYAQVTATFSRGNGVVLGSRTITVAPRSRATINLGDVVQGGGIAAVLTSNNPVVAARSEYIGAPDMAPAGSVVVGRTGAAVRWTFPGGNTVVGNDEVLDLYNPSAVTVPITATFYNANGQMVTRQYTMAPTARIIIPVNPLGLTELHGAVLQSGNGQGFIAEQGISTKDSHLLRSTQGLAQ